MLCSGSARLNHQHLMWQEGWLQAKDSRMWDTWRHQTQGSAAVPTGGRGGSGPLPERGGRRSGGPRLWDMWRHRTRGVGGRAHRGTWRLRTPARAGSGGPEA